MTGEIQEHTYLASACDPRADLILSEDYYSFSSSRAACTGRHLSLLGGGTSEFLSLGLDYLYTSSFQLIGVRDQV